MIIEKRFKTEEITSESILDFISTSVEDFGISETTIVRLSVCTDEIVSNILNHSHAKYIDVTVEVEHNVPTISVSFTDDGEPFNPLIELEEPDFSQPLDERKEGGMGVYMVKKMARNVTYSRNDRQNIFTICI